MKSFSCRTHSILLSNCSFLFYKDLLLYFGYFTSLMVYFLQNWVYFIIKLFFPLLQRFTSMMHLFYFLLGLFLAELLLFYCLVVISSVTKIFYFIVFILCIFRSISYRTGAISSLISFFACYEYYPLYFIIYILWGIFLVEPILLYYQIVLSSTTKIY